MAPALGASLASHALVAAAVLLLVRCAPSVLSKAPSLHDSIRGVVWMNQPGPGGGGGGGGNRMAAPARRLEARGRDQASTPAVVRAVVAPPRALPPVDAPPRDVQVLAPIMSSGASLDIRPGTLDGASSQGGSLGPGSGSGAGGGSGSGIGNGTGPGIGDGTGGNHGGGSFNLGAGIDPPVLVREVKPMYTDDAMRARIQGTAWVECIVLADGSVGKARIVRSLDPTFGLDQEAIKAARQWRFRPGRRLGQPVAVIITIAMDFHVQ